MPLYVNSQVWRHFSLLTQLSPGTIRKKPPRLRYHVQLDRCIGHSTRSFRNRRSRNPTSIPGSATNRRASASPELPIATLWDNLAPGRIRLFRIAPNLASPRNRGRQRPPRASPSTDIAVVLVTRDMAAHGVRSSVPDALANDGYVRRSKLLLPDGRTDAWKKTPHTLKPYTTRSRSRFAR